MQRSSRPFAQRNESQNIQNPQNPQFSNNSNIYGKREAEYSVQSLDSSRSQGYAGGNMNRQPVYENQQTSQRMNLNQTGFTNSSAQDLQYATSRPVQRPTQSGFTFGSNNNSAIQTGYYGLKTDGTGGKSVYSKPITNKYYQEPPVRQTPILKYQPTNTNTYQSTSQYPNTSSNSYQVAPVSNYPKTPQTVTSSIYSNQSTSNYPSTSRISTSYAQGALQPSYSNANNYNASNTMNFSLSTNTSSTTQNYADSYTSTQPQRRSNYPQISRPYSRPLMLDLKQQEPLNFEALKRLQQLNREEIERAYTPKIVLRQRKPRKSHETSESETESDLEQDRLPFTQPRPKRTRNATTLMKPDKDTKEFSDEKDHPRKKSDETSVTYYTRKARSPVMKESEECRTIRLINAVKMKEDSKVFLWEASRMAADDVLFVGMESEEYKELLKNDLKGDACKSVKDEVNFDDTNTESLNDEPTQSENEKLQLKYTNISIQLTPKEIEQFKAGLRCYGRDFYCICKDQMQSSRSVQDLVEHYYIFKYDYGKCYKGNRHLKAAQHKRRSSFCKG